MKFYRPLGAIRAMTFDLDDTLYDNGPVLERAERILLEHLHQQFPDTRHLSIKDWYGFRNQAILHEPKLVHHVTQSRLTALRDGLKHSGYSTAQAHDGAEQALEVLLEARNQIPVPEETHQTLAALAKQIPLVAITNGNADVSRIGLEQYFAFALSAEQHWANKPKRKLFNLASEQLDLPPQQILHVGDHLKADVFGALRSGYQACWINPEQACLRQAPKARLMPHVEIHELSALLKLLK